MQFTVKDLAKIFKTSERTVSEWARKGGLKGQLEEGRYLFNRNDVLEWTTLRGMRVPDDLLEGSDAVINNKHLLTDSILAGGIYHNIQGDNKAEVLKNIVMKLKLPEGIDRGYLLNMILAREKLASTAIGDGIAIPHLRSPIVLKVSTPQVAICFTSNPVDYDAIDGKPVNTLFMIISPSVRLHLIILSRLSYFLKDDKIKALLFKIPTSEEIIKAVKEFEDSLNK